MAQPAPAAFVVQVGAFAVAGNAEAAAARLRNAGFSAARILPTRSLQLVILGPYPSQAEAQAAHQALRAQGWDSYVRHLSAPADSPLIKTSSVPPAADATAPDRQQLAAAGQVHRPSQRTPTRRDTGSGVQGFIQSEMAYTWPSPGHWSKFRQLLEVGTHGALSDQVRWTFNARLSYDPRHAHDNAYPQRVRDDLDYEAMIREAYLDLSAGDWDFRFGRQHIIWGEMVGLFFADVVSAKDLRQFIAQDFDLLRIPQWALRAEHFGDDTHFEAVWIPIVSYDDIGEPGSEFYPFRPDVPAGTGLHIESDQRPADRLGNSAGGLRYGMLRNGWDIAGFYYTALDASPAFLRRIESVPTPRIIFEPHHDRVHQAGVTLAKDFGPAVLKAEAVYTWDRWFSVDRLSDADGVVRQDLLDYIVGLEHVTARGTRINGQFFQRRFTDHDAGIGLEHAESGVSLFLSHDFSASRLAPELLLVQSLNRSDGMARPRLVWRYDDHWRFAAGVDVFWGPDDGLFGRFDRADRVYGEARYAF